MTEAERETGNPGPQNSIRPNSSPDAPRFPRSANSGRARRFSRRTRWLLVACAVAIVTRHSWWPPAFHAIARHSLSAQQPTTALQWLQVAEWLGARRIDTALFKCQASRRLGVPEQIQAAIADAAARGAEPRLIEREQILFQAQSGEMAAAGPYLSRLLRDTTGDNLDVCASYVIGYLRNQRYREAGTLVDALMKDAPNDPFPWYVRGRVSALQQLLPNAEADFLEAIRRSPDWVEPVISLAELYAETHRQREAIPLFEQALRTPAMAGRAAVGLSECLKAIGDPDRARTVLTETRPLAQNDAPLLIALGRMDFEEGRMAEAADSLQKALTIRPWADDALFTLAQCQRQLGQEEQAAATFAKVEEFRGALAELRQLEDQIAATPNDEATRLRSGELMLRYRDPQDGVVALQSVLDLNPACRPAHALLAEYFSRLQPATDVTRRQAEFHRQRSQEAPSAQPGNP